MTNQDAVKFFESQSVLLKSTSRLSGSNVELRRLQLNHPMSDAVISEIGGRRIRIKDHWLTDFASCNYLGFDLDEEIIASIDQYVRSWGTHPSWSRLLGSPILFEEIESKLTALLGCEDTLLFPCITLIHHALIPLLSESGDIFLDSRAHRTIYEGCKFATAYGARVQRFNHNDFDELEYHLRRSSARKRLVCMDGINSMTGNAPDISAVATLIRDYDALLYIDDAHGFGVVGERHPQESCPYGRRGNGVVRHYDESYDNIVFVGGFSKAYSSLLAFVACSTELKQELKVHAPPYLYSGPSPVASLATVLTGLQVNEKRGDALRFKLYQMMDKLLAALDRLGVGVLNTSHFPIVELSFEDANHLDAAGHFLFENSVYVTLAPYPLVPRNQVGFRIQLTAANTQAEVAYLISVLEALHDRFPLQASIEPLSKDSPLLFTTQSQDVPDVPLDRAEDLRGLGTQHTHED